jgi:hypothetical protein
MRRQSQNSMSENAWPTVQYLWPLHPIFEWLNDKAGLLFGRTRPRSLVDNAADDRLCVKVRGNDTQPQVNSVVTSGSIAFFPAQIKCSHTMAEFIAKTATGARYAKPK